MDDSEQEERGVITVAGLDYESRFFAGCLRAQCCLGVIGRLVRLCLDFIAPLFADVADLLFRLLSSLLVSRAAWTVLLFDIRLPFCCCRGGGESGNSDIFQVGIGDYWLSGGVGRPLPPLPGSAADVGYLFSLHHDGPKEFTQVFYSLHSWRAIFERFDRDRSGKIDTNELREALLSLGFSVSPVVLELLVSKFDKSGGKYKAIEYDNFIECCLTVKGLTEKFKEKDTSLSGSATFTYESFMLTVLPFLIA
ncbi:calcium-binding protein CBP-like [Salvia divinorum]|uniref:Calcium-binding protein CBP-like n=1 Tax=Salvia divinorum TaxID=28513 RepID=A0ABD1GUF3_SALDI